MKFQPSLLAIAVLVSTVGVSLPLKANSSPNIPWQIAQSSSQMETQMTFQGKDKIDTMIRESGSEFHFHGTLTRTSGNMFTGSDNQVNVSYDQSSGRIVIVNKVTGTQFYNYIYSGNSNTNTSGTQTNSQYNVSNLQDLVGVRASGGETQLQKRGYEYVRGMKEGNSSYTYWKNTSTGECIVVRTEDGRYQSLVASPNECVDSTVHEGAL